MPLPPDGSTQTDEYLGYDYKYIFTIPAWNDIIHLAVQPQWTDEDKAWMGKADLWINTYGLSYEAAASQFGVTVDEVKKAYYMLEDYETYQLRAKEQIEALLTSSVPELVQNLGAIAAALDDIQDFATTVGVISRVIGRAYAPADYVAVGAFTIGEFLNKINAVHLVTGGEKAVICRLVRSLKNSSTMTTIKGDVSKRMKRIFPSKGEILEIAQTTDALFGVGISFGPLVGLAQDLYFAGGTASEARFKSWTMTHTEQEALWNILTLGGASRETLEDWENRRLADFEACSYVLCADKAVSWANYAYALAVSIEGFAYTRGSRIVEALGKIWESLGDNEASPQEWTSTDTKQILQDMGYNPYADNGWPVSGLGATAGIQAIMDAFSAAAQKQMQYWRDYWGSSNEGQFLDAAVKSLSDMGAAMFTDADSDLEQSLKPEVLIYIRAINYGLQPPPNTSNSDFEAWLSYLMNRGAYFDTAIPDKKYFDEAYDLYFR